ncbi:hypothetical protein GCM10023084_78990 [Streptomyces lacrimifluminis]|uniref:HTH cro/C1-type domain-containing protein n=1 Tax=Streptomyces lacrimifluminis TaxID=1500077 RepID=A0A917PAS9_9ACTN|nr:XRE family transcriptional regulator [Streptomyces lacrimifluminis]GGJ68896.1 hypothetical protein GCM10012282_77340 [Streptomyces lacrimifluminis]
MTLPPEHVRLSAELRELRQRTGLSLAGLAAKTACSKSSWERYLNGRTLPPRPVVRELCALAGEPEGRCLALWEIAESQWSGRAAQEPPPYPAAAPPVSAPPVSAPPPVPAPAGRVGSAAGHRTPVLIAVLASVCAAAVAGVAVALLLLPGEPRPSSSPPPSAASSPAGPYCRGVACEGRDPMAMKCGAQPDTLARHRMSTGAWMELRYNRYCGASWARMWGTRIGDRIEMRAGGAGSPVRRAEIEDVADRDAFVYTSMAVTRPGTVVSVCFRPVATGKKECFDSHVTQGVRTHR